MTTSFNKARGCHVYSFMIDGRRFQGVCIDPRTGEKAKTPAAATRAENEARAAAVKELKDGAKPVALEAYTFGEAVAAYVTVREGENYWTTEERHVADLLAYYGPDKPVIEFDEVEIEAYARESKKAACMQYIGGRKPPEHPTPEEYKALWRPMVNGRLRSNSTTNKHLLALQGILKLAHKTKDKVTRKPRLESLPDFSEAWLSVIKRKPRPIADVHLAGICTDTKTPDYVRDAVALVRNMGFRKAEVFGLTIDHIDFARRGIWLDGEDTKGKRDESLHANPEAWAIIERLVAQARARGTLWLFARPIGRQREGARGWRQIKNPTKSFYSALTRQGIGGKHTFHNTKASFVTATAKVAPGAVVQKRARHKSFATTQRYIDIDAADEVAAADAIGFTASAPVGAGEKLLTGFAYGPETGSDDSAEVIDIAGERFGDRTRDLLIKRTSRGR